jgi:hypothetical protein
MGMYTTLRFTAHLTPAGMKIVEQLHEANAQKAKDWYDPSMPLPVDGAWDRIAPSLRALGDAQGGQGMRILSYLHQPRRDFIPFGAYREDWTRTEFAHDVWNVQCELKNYNDEIKHFLRDVLPFLLAETCTAYSQYEEHDEETEHHIKPIGGPDGQNRAG